MIEVRGETATGKWYLFQPRTLAEGNQAVWLAARYEEEYVKVSGEWQFTHLKVFSAFMTPYDQGWVKKKFVLGVQAREKSQEDLLCESLMEMRIF